MLRAALIVTITSALAGCGATQQSTKMADPLPPIELPVADGAAVWRSADVAGRPLVVDIWASWCKPCRKGFPLLNDMARAHTDVSFVAVSVDEDPAAARAFAREVSIDMPVVLDREQTLLEAPLKITRVPTILLVDRAGVIRYRFEEPSDADYARIRDLLGEL